MIFHLIYTITGSLFLILGLVVNLKPDLFKKLLITISDREIFILPGILELIISLALLYFRYDTKIPFIITMTGILMFIDGVFYLIATRAVKESIQMLLDMEQKYMRYYSLIFFLIAGIIFIGGYL